MGLSLLLIGHVLLTAGCIIGTTPLPEADQGESLKDTSFPSSTVEGSETASDTATEIEAPGMDDQGGSQNTADSDGNVNAAAGNQPQVTLTSAGDYVIALENSFTPTHSFELVDTHSFETLSEGTVNPKGSFIGLTNTPPRSALLKVSGDAYEKILKPQALTPTGENLITTIQDSLDAASPDAPFQLSLIDGGQVIFTGTIPGDTGLILANLTQNKMAIAPIRNTTSARELRLNQVEINDDLVLLMLEATDSEDGPASKKVFDIIYSEN